MADYYFSDTVGPFGFALGPVRKALRQALKAFLAALAAQPQPRSEAMEAHNDERWVVERDERGRISSYNIHRTVREGAAADADAGQQENAGTLPPPPTGMM